MTTHGSGRIPFERLCRDIRDRLFATGVALTANPEDAEDAVQDTLLKLWSVRNRISDAAHFRNLALSVMRHTCLNLIRSRTVRRADTLDEELDAPAADTPLTLMERDEKVRRMRRAWYALPAPQRALLNMKEVEGMTIEDIAALLGITACNVRQRLSRARKMLLAQMGGGRGQ